jgi:SAM-dependent methyltransferase
MGIEDTPTALPAVQQHLFGEPAFRPSLGQWHTPMAVCRRLAQWIPVGRRILEPSCGAGNIIAALLDAGHQPENITGVEIDPAWAEHTRRRFDLRVSIYDGDFLSMGFGAGFDVVAMNSPFENNLHLEFVLRALQLAPAVIGVFPCAFEFSGERDAKLWATKGIVVRRARLPNRVDYGGSQSPSFDSCVLSIRRRVEPRRVDEVTQVNEEVWS